MIITEEVSYFNKDTDNISHRDRGKAQGLDRSDTTSCYGMRWKRRGSVEICRR